MGVRALQRTQLGKESGGSPGTAVAATTIWRGPAGNQENDQQVMRAPENIAIAIPTVRTYVPRLGAKLSMPATEATFEQLPYILEAGIKLETPAQDGAGSDYIYEYEVGYTSINTIETYTLETGDNTQAYEMEYGFVESFTLSGNAAESLMMSAEWIGRQTKKVSFTGGLSIPAVEEILGGNGTIYFDATSGSYGGTAITAGTVLAFNLDITTGWRPKYTIDNSELYFHSPYFDFDSFEVTLGITFEHNSSAVTEYDNFVAETYRLVRLLFDGSAFGTGGTTYSNHTLLVDIAGNWETFSKVDEQDGNSIVEATLKGGYDTTDATALKFTVVNELSSLT